MIKGSMVALITPYNEDLSVNYDKIRELVEWHIAEGTDGIVALGTTAESPALSTAEQEEIVKTVIETVNGRIPVVVGAGSNNTLVSLEKCLKFQEMGADALLVITPYYNKTNKAGMVNHFKTMADAVEIPLILYNVPGRTGCALSYDVVAELAPHKNVMAVKEASGDMSFATQISRLIDDEFTVYSGNDDITIPIMSMGGSGVISVLADACPKATSEMVHAWLDGDIKKARDMQCKYLDFINALFIETNPIPVKEAMNMMGMEVGGYRMPLYEMSEGAKEVLRKTMVELGLIK